ncbi:MAG: PucR family transcriptional regulator ligand-binding domain-containing protein [Oscillibacter sp.]|jgi:sugar diacid utilization regulator|nr:PucR family transcriptional regulator ligand-binding domain-containing protein [Oscillibacter sp.]
MEYTLADLCSNHPIPEFQQLTKSFDFSGIAIESACVQEVNDVENDFILRNELVLSTAEGCAEDKTSYIRMIRIVSAAHAAALIYTLRDERYAIPSEAIACADVLKLPVFTIPWKYRLSDLHAFVVKQIQEKKLQAYREVQSALFNLFFDSQSLDRAASLIAQILTVPIAVEDRMGAKKGCSGTLPPNRDPDREEIRINGELAGYLCLYRAPGNTAPDLETLRRFVLSPLSLWFYRKNIEDMTVMKLKNNFVWDLANHDYSSFAEMVRQGNSLHFDLDKPYTCIMMKAFGRDAGVQPTEYSSEAAKAASVIESVLLDIGSLLGIRIMLAERNMQFIIYAENIFPNPVNVLNQFLDEADKRLLAAQRTLEFRWGISETTDKPPEFDRLRDNAALALRYCISARSGCRRFTYRDTREAQILSILSDQEEVRQAAQDVLRQLMEYSASSRTDLLATLSEFIRSNYNTSLTARNLHIQRQSLLYRLEKIESLTGLSLSSHRDLFLLEIYTRIFTSY